MLKKDFVKIGETTTSNSYERVPIEAFGKSMLSKQGWVEDAKMPLGKNPNSSNYVEPAFANLMPRQSRLGLGAKPLTHEEMKKLGHKRP